MTRNDGLLWVTSEQADRLARAVTMFLEMYDGSNIKDDELRRRFSEMVATVEAINQN